MISNLQSANAYEILGVPRGAGIPVLKQAFKKLALKHHPDAVPAEEKERANLLFAKINQAHELLRDAQKRRKYDLLLDRGITPDLNQEIGQVHDFASLASILGEIKSLNLPFHEKELVKPIDVKFKEFLLDDLIEGEGVHETVVDVLPIAQGGFSSKNYEAPPGPLQAGWIVVTELRLIVFLRFEHKNYIYWRWKSFPYPSLANLVVHEKGNVYPSYEVEMEDEDHTLFQLQLSKPRLTRLFLVANTYKLPLKIQARGRSRGEYVTEFFKSLLIPLLVWCVPYALAIIPGLFTKDGPCTYYPVVFDWLSAQHLTTLALYAPGFLFMLLFLKIYRSWHLGLASEVVGDLPADYAAGIPGGVPDRPATASPGEEETPHPRKEQAAPALEPPPALAPDGGTPLEVEMPSAVREAFGAPEPPTGPGPQNLPPREIVCPLCGHGNSISSQEHGWIKCAKCGQEFPVQS